MILRLVMMLLFTKSLRVNIARLLAQCGKSVEALTALKNATEP